MTYVPPAGIKPETITAKMKLRLSSAPRFWVARLKAFIGGTKHRLVSACTTSATHIVTAVEAMGKKPSCKKMTLTMRPHDRSLKIQHKIKAHDLDNSKAATELANALK